MMNCMNCDFVEGWGDDEHCTLKRCVKISRGPWLFEHNLPLIKHSLPRAFYVQDFDFHAPVFQKFLMLLKCHTSCLCKVTEHPSKIRIEFYDPCLGRIKGKEVKEIPLGVIPLEELYENYRDMKYYNPCAGAAAGAAAGFVKEKAAKKVKKNIIKERRVKN